jgi:arylsulfatase A-like enzyme
MTGLHPESHQAHRNSYPIDKSFVMMAEVLRKAGYSTGGFVSVKLVGSKIGFAQGFEYFSDSSPPGAKDDKPVDGSSNRSSRGDHTSSVLVRRGDKTVEEALEWLKAHIDEKYFLWVHLYDPHLPYTPPKEYGLKYNPGYNDYLKTVRNPRYRAHDFADNPELEEKEPRQKTAKPRRRTEKLFKKLFGVDLNFLFQSPLHVEPDKVLDFISAYDGEISFDDAILAKIFQYVEEEKKFDDTIIIIMGDHGEILHEKEDYFGHHKYLYQGSIKIPLIMKIPGIPPGKIDRTITNVDILPTLLDALDIKNKLKMDGVSYWPLISKNKKITSPDYRIILTNTGKLPDTDKPPPAAYKKGPRTVLVRIKLAFKILFPKLTSKSFKKRRWKIDEHFQKIAIIKGDWKLIRTTITSDKKEYKYELYNLKLDKLEQDDLYIEEEMVVRELETDLKKYIKQKRKVAVPEAETEKSESERAEELKELKSLGYVQ